MITKIIIIEIITAKKVVKAYFYILNCVVKYNHFTIGYFSAAQKNLHICT